MVNPEKQRARAAAAKVTVREIDGWTVRDHGERFDPKNIVCRNCGGNNWHLIGSDRLGPDRVLEGYLCSECRQDAFCHCVTLHTADGGEPDAL